MEVRTKEELAEELNLAQVYFGSTITLGNGFDRVKVDKILKRFSPSRVVYYVYNDYKFDEKQISQDFTFLTEKPAPPLFQILFA